VSGKRTELLGFLIVLVFALAMRLLFFRGVFAVDDFNYLRHAAECWKGSYDLADVSYWHGMRPMIFFPVSLIFAGLGVSELTAVLWPLAASVVTVIAVYRIGRLLFGPEKAFLGGCVAAMLPLSVNEATRLLPEPVINLVVALFVWCYVESEFSRSESRRRSLLFLSGVFVGVMPWTGQLGLVLVTFFPLALVLLRRHAAASYLPIAAGALSILGLGTLNQWVATGDPFVNVAMSRVVLTAEDPAHRPLFYARLLFWPLAAHGGVLYLAAAGAVASILRRDRRGWLLTAWLAAIYLIMEFGTTSVTSYRPLFKQLRYLSVVMVPGALLAGAGLAEIRRRIVGLSAGRLPVRGAVRVANGSTALLLLGALAGSVATLGHMEAWGEQERRRVTAVARHVRAHTGEAVYVVHWLWNARVGYFMSYDDAYFPSGYTPYAAVSAETTDPRSRNRYVQSLSAGEPMAPGILIVDERMLDISLRSDRVTGMLGPGEIPAMLRNPPDSWPVIERIDGVTIYEIPGGTWPE
jgi:hypothetical protein